MFNNGDIDPVTLKHVNIAPFPSFTANIRHHTGRNHVAQSCIVDSGCTGECIINREFANLISAEVKPSAIRGARLAYKEKCLSIVGETQLHGQIMGNDFY